MPEKRPTFEKKNEAKDRLRNLLTQRVDPNGVRNPTGDFGVTSMFCGSGRTPATQHWPIPEFDKARGDMSFTYKDTTVFYNVEKNNVEIVTTGPGTGRGINKLGATTGGNPSIEEMRTQQREVLEMVAEIRRDMCVSNPNMKVLPRATIVGFSRGGAAVQHASVDFVAPSLPIFKKSSPEEQSTLPTDRIELDKEKKGEIICRVYQKGKPVVASVITQGELTAAGSSFEIASMGKAMKDEHFKKDINRILLDRGMAGAGSRVLVDNANSLWISLDSVAGRPNPITSTVGIVGTKLGAAAALDDHRVNPECNGIYAMSTKLQTLFSAKGFRPTNPHDAGENWSQLAVNGPHGAVFDNNHLRKIILDNTDGSKSVSERKQSIEQALTREDRLLRMGSVLGPRFQHNEAAKAGPVLSTRDEQTYFQEVQKNPLKAIKDLEIKIKAEQQSFWPSGAAKGAARAAGFGGGRETERQKQFESLHAETALYVQAENIRRTNEGLPTLESLAEMDRVIASFVDKLQIYTEARKGDPKAAAQCDYVNGVLQQLVEVRSTMSLESSNPVLVAGMEKFIETVSNALGALSTKALEEPLNPSASRLSMPTFFSSEPKTLGALLTQFKENLTSELGYLKALAPQKAVTAEVNAADVTTAPAADVTAAPDQPINHVENAKKQLQEMRGEVEPDSLTPRIS
jgi:hypothetical protein